MILWFKFWYLLSYFMFFKILKSAVSFTKRILQVTRHKVEPQHCLCNFIYYLLVQYCTFIFKFSSIVSTSVIEMVSILKLIT